MGAMRPGWPGRPGYGSEPLPARIGPYRVQRPLGEGALGRVYLATRASGSRQAAVKLLRPELAADAAYRARFAAEAAAARTVSGRFIAPVVDADPYAALPWVATAYVPGPTLEQRIRRSGLMDERRLRELGRALAEALVSMHRAGVAHGALRPGNVLMSVDGPRVVDFGISRVPTASAAGYIAPEQISGTAGAGLPGDVFALGAVLTYAALGRSPFGTGDPRTLAYRAAHEAPDLSGVPADLTALIVRCLAGNPHARPSLPETLGELASRPENVTVTVTVPVAAAPAASGASVASGASSPSSAASRLPLPRRGVLKAAGIAAAAVTVVAGGLSLLETFGVLTDGHQDIPSGAATGASAHDAGFTGVPQGFKAAPAPLWTSTPATPPDGGGLQVLGSTLIWLSGTSQGASTMLAFDASSGRRAWPASTTAQVTNTPGGKWCGVYGSRLYGVAPADSGSELYGLDAQGALVIHLRLNARVNDVLCVSANTLIATTGTDNSVLTTFDLRSGRSVWSGSNPGDKASNVVADPESNRCFLFGSSTATALDVANGRTLWKAGGVLDAASANAWFTPHALVLGSTGATIALDPVSGRRLWRSNAYLPIAIAESGSMVYALGTGPGTGSSSTSSSVAALDAQDGTVRWTFHSPVPLQTTLATLGAANTGAGTWGSGRVLALPYQGTSTTAGGLLTLDGATGKPLWAYAGAAGGGDQTGRPVTVDGTRVYAASATALRAFSVPG